MRVTHTVEISIHFVGTPRLSARCSFQPWFPLNRTERAGSKRSEIWLDRECHNESASASWVAEDRLYIIAFGASAGNVVAQDVIPSAFSPPQEINFQGATLKEEALLRRQIQIMRPEVLPPRVVFVPRWKYVVNTKTYRFQVPAGIYEHHIHSPS